MHDSSIYFYFELIKLPIFITCNICKILPDDVEFVVTFAGVEVGRIDVVIAELAVVPKLSTISIRINILCLDHTNLFVNDLIN